VDKVAAEVFAETGTKIEYSVGTMIELPRAAILADKIAEDADFFSFGTNDLTQTVFGLSRDEEPPQAGDLRGARRRSRLHRVLRARRA
jgi:pyruvate,orthophosphate dikinase